MLPVILLSSATVFTCAISNTPPLGLLLSAKLFELTRPYAAPMSHHTATEHTLPKNSVKGSLLLENIIIPKFNNIIISLYTLNLSDIKKISKKKYKGVFGPP